MSRALFVAGAGGTGKTTVAGALAVAAAAAGHETLVITVDPALRLAQALGLGHLGSEPVAVPGAPRLHAAMLDAAAAWEAVVHRHADIATADRLIESPYFRAVADRFPSGQAYAVAEETSRIVVGDSFDVVVVDTPPIGGGIDFFDAPERIRSLVAGRALRLLTGPSVPGKRMLFSLTARPALHLADRLLGGAMLEDVAEFLLDLRSIYDGIRTSSTSIQRLIESSDRVVVATPDRGPAWVASAVLNRLDETPGTVILNRVLPASWADFEPGATPAHDSNAARWAAEAQRQQKVVREFTARNGTTVLLPWLTSEPTSLEALAELAIAGDLGRLF